jgi:hypothetical protein
VVFAAVSDLIRVQGEGRRVEDPRLSPR